MPDRRKNHTANVRRFPAIVLLLAIAAVASGAARYVHEMSHAHAAPSHAGHAHGHHRHDHHHGGGGEEPAAPVPHDESTCLIHALLKLPMLGAGFTPLLVCLGLFVAFLTLLPVQVRSRRPILQLDCRGPPVC